MKRIIAMIITIWAITFLSGAALAQNQPPIADAGPDKNAYTGVPVTLFGSAYDPDGDPILGWSWAVEQTPAPNSYRIASADTQNLMLIGYVQGDYLVSLTVTDGMDGGIDFAIVHVADNLPPVAVATADNNTITVGEEVCFDGSQSYDPEGRPLGYTWDFDDGSLPALNQVSVCHVYQNVGVFDAFLRVSDEVGAADFDYVSITVLPPANHLPTASPTASPNSGDAPLLVQFAANASDLDGDPLTYLWDFGDGTTSTAENPQHTYTMAGTYTASLTVSDNTDSASYSLTIAVNPHMALSVESASVKWTKKGTLASVDVQAYFAGPIPAANDIVKMSFDGVSLFAAPFSAFASARGEYSWKEKNVSVSINFALGVLAVHCNKLVMTGFDETNGVDVQLDMGPLTAVENILMTETHGNRLIYSAPVQ